MAKSEKYNVRVASVNTPGQSFTGDDGKVYHNSSFAPAEVKDAIQTLKEGMLVEITAAYSEKTGKYYINGLFGIGEAPVLKNPEPKEAATPVNPPVAEEKTNKTTAASEVSAPSTEKVPEPKTTPAPAQAYVNPQALKDDRITRMACLNTATEVLQAHGTIPKHSIYEAADSVLRLASVFERAVHQGFKPVLEDIKPQIEKIRAAAAEERAAQANIDRLTKLKKVSSESDSGHVEERTALALGGRR